MDALVARLTRYITLHHVTRVFHEFEAGWACSAARKDDSHSL